MVALKEYQTVLRGPPACTVSLQFRAEVAEVHTLRVYAFDNSGGFTPFPSLKADFYKLLLHADGSADAEILREPTSGAYFRHSLVHLLLLVHADIDSDAI